MLKKNTRKRLLAGALATVMMLTMCPSWALADDEDIATLPLVDENRPVAESAPVEADPTETPAVPTPSEPEAKPAKDQNTAPAPSDDGANGGTDSTETGNSTNPTIPEGSENNSQNNDTVSNSPENEISTASLDVDAYSLNNVKKIEAEYWITNRRAVADGTSTLEIASDRNGITDADGLAITDIVPNERDATTTDGNYNTVFWQARVQHVLHQGTGSNDDKTQFGTEITRIRYTNGKYGWDGKFEYLAKGSDEWTKFALATDHLVFYYLIRTGYSQMVQIDVSDWTVDKEQTQYRDRRSVTYQVIVEGGNEDGTDEPVASRTFWYNKAFKVSSVRVREIGNDPNYSIDRVVLDPLALGTVTDENGEYRFSLDLRETKHNATVKIYVKPNVQQVQLAYELNDGIIKSAENEYTHAGWVWPDETITTPTVEKTDCVFAGWYTDKALTQEWTGTKMPNENLTLYAKWTDSSTPVEPGTTTPAKYFVLLPTRTAPTSGASQGWTSYLPNETSDGGVKDVSRKTGYKGFLTAAGRQAADRAYDTDDKKNGVFDDKGFGDDYLVPPTDLGFFDADNWSSDGKIYNSEKESNTTNPFSVLGENFNVKNNIRVVWYTIKYQGDEKSYHVDGYVTGVPVTVTYHSNYGTIPGMTDESREVPAMSGDTHTVLNNTFTVPTGFSFGGWYTDPDYTKGTEKAVGSDELLMTDLHLYAKWNPINSEVSYFYQNEQGNATQFGGIDTYAFGTDVTVRTAHPEKEGYTFTGWTPAADVANIIEVVNGKFTMPAQNVCFNGTFEINQYTVTYKVDGKDYGNTETYVFNSDVAIRPVPTKEGYTFSGWKIGTADAENFKMPAHDVVIEGKFEKNPAKQYTYTVNKHFCDEKGVEVKVEKGEAKTGYEYALVSELYKNDAKNQTVNEKTYVYVPGLTTVTDNLETLTKDVTIDLYYYLNVEGGNDIPDAWEYRLTFKVVNGEWTNGGNADIVTYVQFKDQTTGEAFKDEAVVVPVTRIPAVGDKPNSGYHAGAWDTSPYDNYKVQKDTVFTYTYAKNSSGGSSGGHHRRPTVTIPDKVPTGLNGNDHYAYIVGYPDKTVRPQNGITRAEVATIFFRLLTDETRNANSTKSNSYSDVAAGAWYNHAVSTLSAMGIVKGDSNGKFNPNAPITRAEFAAIAARFDDKANSTTADFSDIVSHWAKNEISAASNNGWINGYPDGTFRPDNKITRAEAMTLVNRVLKRLPETAEDLHDDMIKWSDNSDVSQWFYLAVQEATNSHYYKAKENKFEKWSELRDTRDWTELEK